MTDLQILAMIVLIAAAGALGYWIGEWAVRRRLKSPLKRAKDGLAIVENILAKSAKNDEPFVSDAERDGYVTRGVASESAAKVEALAEQAYPDATDALRRAAASSMSKQIDDALAMPPQTATEVMARYKHARDAIPKTVRGKRIVVGRGKRPAPKKRAKKGKR